MVIPGSFGHTKLFWPDSALLVIPGLTGYLDSRSLSGMIMGFGFGFPIGVGNDSGGWSGMTMGFGRG